MATFGAACVLGVQIVVDSGWHPSLLDNEQTVLIDNSNIDGTLYTYDEQPANQDQCKNGGWQTLTHPDGTPFKNQGDCIQFANTGK